MEEFIMVPIVVAIVLIGLPWLIFHYVTKWKTAARLTGSDEKLLDDLYDAARRLDDRLCSIERIMTAENPDWRKDCLPGTRSRESGLLPDIDDLSRRTERLLRDRK